ncbi:MAG: alpha/beta hydrolase [Rhizobium sp.]|nr:alpha/beta hydrolase [Rhizobium sp.]
MQRRDFIYGALVLGWSPVANGNETMKSSTKRVTVGEEVALSTESTGNAARGTILLVMGATASMVWWPESLVKRLASAGYQVIRFDHRDTGRSTTNAPGDVRYDVSDIASDLIAILDAYNVEAAHVVGMSLGGYVSQIAALTHPDRILSLTLIATEPLGIPYDGEGIDPRFMDHFSRMAELDWSDHDTVASFMLRIAELNAGSVAHFDRKASMRRIETELQRTSSMQSAFNHSLIAGELDPNLKASNLDLPVLLVHGREDPIISVKATSASESAIKGAQVLVLEGRGHELLEQDMPQLAGAILAHVGRQEQR